MESRSGYTAEDIEVLEGLDPVKVRPGMYSNTDSPLHIVQEVIDNAADEALGGHASWIRVTLHQDHSVTVEDNGRGIPVEAHPQKERPAIEVILTSLHSGGKFRKASDRAYAFSGGLHGVGVAVTNALSVRLEATVKRGGRSHRIAFAAGEVAEPLQEIGTTKKGDTGTAIRAWPDPRYFESARLDPDPLRRVLRSKAVLLPGLRVELVQEKAQGEPTGETWQYEQGMTEYLTELLADREQVSPIYTDGRFYTDRDGEDFHPGEGADWAIAWVREGTGLGESFVNLIPTAQGGTHVNGLRNGATEALRAFAEHHSLLPRGIKKLSAEDVGSGACFILSARLLDPQFQGQVKEKLTSREAVKLVASMFQDRFELWLAQNPEAGKAIVEQAVTAARHRLNANKKAERKKSGNLATLPGKLTDCEASDPERTELFIVEGDSAGGSAKQARDREIQAILPLRGKVLNTWEVDAGDLYGNREVHDIAVSIGVDPHGPSEAPDLTQLRYGKIVILADADVDGAHIQTLLIGLFLRHFPKLIEHGHLFVAYPPLYRLDLPGQGKHRTARRIYVLDEPERDATLEKLASEGVATGKVKINRFKGLGEMNPDQLWETCLSPDTRRVLPLYVAPGEVDATWQAANRCLSTRERAARRAWIGTEGNRVEPDL